MPSFWASQVVLAAKNPPASAGDARDMGSIPGSGRSPGEENGSPLQQACLGNPMDRERSLVGYSPWGHKELDMTELVLFFTLFLVYFFFLSFFFFNSTHHLLKYEMMCIVCLSLLTRTKSPILTSDGLKCLEQCLAHRHSKRICGMRCGMCCGMIE